MSYEDQREKSRKRISFSTSLIDFFFGVLMIAVGTILLKGDHFNIKSIVKFCNERDTLLIQIFGVVSVVYGIWRLYRGYDKIKNN
jgi:hypothetical protein